MAAPEPRRAALTRRVESWAERLRVRPRLVRVRRMTRKWGSCSTAGTITLASDLPDQGPGFQDFVIAHELLHLRIPNHGKLFRAVLAAHLPDWRAHDIRRGAPPARPPGAADAEKAGAPAPPPSGHSEGTGCPA